MRKQSARKPAENKVGKASKVKSRKSGSSKARGVSSKTRKAAKPKRRRAPYNAATIRVLAMKAEDLAAAEELLDSKRRRRAKPLVEVLASFEHLQAAWDRGRFLRNVRDLAGTGAAIHEAAQELGLTAEGFQSELDRDPELRDVWNQTRISATIEIRRSLVEAAMAGKASAVNHVIESMRSQIAAPRTNFHRLPVADAATATGKSRQTLHAWRAKHDAPGNSDGTIDLPVLLAWWEKWIAERSAGPPSAKSLSASDPLKRAKAEKLALELRSQRSELLARSEVIAGIVARHQALIDASKHTAGELAVILQGQSPDRIREVIEDALADIRKKMTVVPDFLRLPPAGEKLFRRLLEILDTGEGP